jgi:hypothetical protein
MMQFGRRPEKLDRDQFNRFHAVSTAAAGDRWRRAAGGPFVDDDLTQFSMPSWVKVPSSSTL